MLFSTCWFRCPCDMGFGLGWNLKDPYVENAISGGDLGFLSMKLK